MPLVLTSDCRIYWNYQVHDLSEGTAIPEGEFAEHLRSFVGPTIYAESEEAPAPKRRTRRDS